MSHKQYFKPPSEDGSSLMVAIMLLAAVGFIVPMMSTMNSNMMKATAKLKADSELSDVGTQVQRLGIHCGVTKSCNRYCIPGEAVPIYDRRGKKINGGATQFDLGTVRLRSLCHSTTQFEIQALLVDASGAARKDPTTNAPVEWKSVYPNFNGRFICNDYNKQDVWESQYEYPGATQNPTNRFDVDRSGTVDTSDRGPIQDILDSYYPPRYQCISFEITDFYLDVNGDGFLSSKDLSSLNACLASADPQSCP